MASPSKTSRVTWVLLGVVIIALVIGVSSLVLVAMEKSKDLESQMMKERKENDQRIRYLESRLMDEGENGKRIAVLESRLMASIKQQNVFDEQWKNQSSSLEKKIFSFENLMGCGAGWMPHKGSCYRFTQCTDTASCTVNHARDMCRANACTLASIQSEEENTFVSSLASDGIRNLFIGGRDDLKEGRWLWGDGTLAVYTKWSSGQPDNGGGGQQCMLIWRQRDNYWDDYGCDHQQDHVTSGYVCEIPSWVTIQ